MGAVVGDGVFVGLASFCETTGDADSLALGGVTVGLGVGRMLLRGLLRGLLRPGAGLLLGVGSDTEAQKEDTECG